MCDEEMSYFFDNYNRLILGYNDGWGRLIFSIEYDSVSKILVDSIIVSHGGFLQQKNVQIEDFDDSLLLEIDEDKDYQNYK